MRVEIDFSTDAAAAKTLNTAYDKFFGLLDHIATFHPAAVPPRFAAQVFRGLVLTIPDNVSASMEGTSS